MRRRVDSWSEGSDEIRYILEAIDAYARNIDLFRFIFALFMSV